VLETTALLAGMEAPSVAVLLVETEYSKNVGLNALAGMGDL